MFDRLFDHGSQRLSLDRLRSFLRVAEAGGIARAAPGNQSLQSQLSRQLTELEAFFGHALTEREGRGRVLTPSGVRLAILVRETFQRLEDLATEGGDDPVRFELGAGDSALQWWIIPRAGRILASLPKVSLALTSLSAADIVDRLESAQLDLGLVRAAEVPRPREVDTRLLGRVDYAVYVAKDAMAKAGARTVEDVLSRVPLALQQSEPTLNDCLRPLLGGELPTALACETFPQACRAVRSGRYASLLPMLARDDLPARDFASFQPPIVKKLGAKLALVWHPRLIRQRPRARDVIEALTRGLSLPPTVT